MTDRDSGLDLTCPVCYDVYTAPRFLPCHHTLCTHCITDLMERAGPSGHFPCPLCQAKVDVPEEGVTVFQVNFYVAPLLAARARLSMEQPSQMRLHSGRLGKLTPTSSPSSSFDLSCGSHCDGGDKTYFCRSCSCLVCLASCPNHQGQGHQLVDVISEAQTQRSEIRRQLLSLTTFQGALADLEDEGKQRVAALEASCQQVGEQMTATCQEACSALSSRADNSREKVAGLKGRIAKVVQGEMSSIQEKMAALSTLLTSARDVLAASDTDFLRQNAKLTAKIRSVMSKVPPSRGQLQFAFKMSRDVHSLLHKQGNSGFGFVTVHFHSPVLRHRMTLTSTKQDRKLRKLCALGDGSVLAAVGNCLVTISSELSETRRLEFPGEVVDFVPGKEGCVYVVLPFPHAVKKLNTATDVAGDFVCPLNPATAIALTDKQDLMLASNDGKELSLTVYNTAGARLKRVTLPQPDLNPLSLAVTKGGRVYVAGPSQLLCLDTDFSDLDSLTDLPDLRPRCLSGLRGMGSGVGDVLLANWAAGNVEVVEMAEDKLTRKTDLIQWKRGTTQEKADLTKGVLENISCAVVDPAGRLWVGQENGQVSVYDWLLRAT